VFLGEVAVDPGDFALDLGRNVVHGSDTEPGSNEREVSLFFDDEELVDYERIDETWLYE
jgi:nucleoside-diphosphate kinase